MLIYIVQELDKVISVTNFIGNVFQISNMDVACKHFICEVQIYHY